MSNGMRRKFIAGNWKMNTTRAEAVALARAIGAKVAASNTVDVAVCPPSLYLEAVGEAIKGSAVGLGAQNCYPEKEGAFTGEVSPLMLVDLGCKYVILGHSERRKIMGEGRKKGIAFYGTLSITRRDIMEPFNGGDLVWDEAKIENRTVALEGELLAMWGAADPG